MVHFYVTNMLNHKQNFLVALIIICLQRVQTLVLICFICKWLLPFHASLNFTVNPILLSMSRASILLIILASLFDECISFYMDSANFVGFLFFIPWIFSVCMTFGLRCA